MDVTQRSMKTAVGTPPFAAPEIFMNMDDGTALSYSSKVDIFSLGLTFLAIIQEKDSLVPEGKRTRIKIGMKMLDENDYTPVDIEKDDDEFTTAIKELILKMVVYDGKKRLSAYAVKQELDGMGKASDMPVVRKIYRVDPFQVLF